MTADPTSLNRLHDIVAPPPAPWWPPAPGWYWLGGIAAVLTIYAATVGLIRWQRNRYRREALAEWRRMAARCADAGTRADALAELAVLLKRTALSAFPRPRVAALTGAPWRAFLAGAARMDGFTCDIAALLERAAYGQLPPAEVDDETARRAAAFVREWVIRHRRPGAVGGAG